MLEIWKNMLHKKGYVYVLCLWTYQRPLTLHHDLTITKLEAYGFPHNSLQYIRSYLPNRQPRVRVNSSFNTCENTIAGVSLGSILRLLLFNVFINDLFLFVSNSHLINYADDNTITT